MSKTAKESETKKEPLKQGQSFKKPRKRERNLKKLKKLKNRDMMKSLGNNLKMIENTESKLQQKVMRLLKEKEKTTKLCLQRCQALRMPSNRRFNLKKLN